MMKSDLKDILLATAIYLGLLIIGTLLFFGAWFASSRYPVLDNIVRIFGVIFYTVFIIYALVRLLVKKQQK